MSAPPIGFFALPLAAPLAGRFVGLSNVEFRGRAQITALMEGGCTRPPMRHLRDTVGEFTHPTAVFSSGGPTEPRVERNCVVRRSLELPGWGKGSESANAHVRH